MSRLIWALFLTPILGACEKGSKAPPAPASASPSADASSSVTPGVSTSPTPSSGVVTNPTPLVNPSTGVVFNLCIDGKPKVDPEYGSYFDAICTNLTNLRDAKLMYKGVGNPAINESHTNDSSAQTTAMKIYTSMLISGVNAKSYYNYMKLQAFKPGQVASAGFATDQYVTYQIKSTTANSVIYDYQNSRYHPEVSIKYVGTYKFFEILPGSIYAVGTKLTQSIESVKSLSGLVIIQQNGSDAEVFSLSDQTASNGNDPNKAISRGQSSVVTQMKRDFQNGKKAANADRFFP